MLKLPLKNKKRSRIVMEVYFFYSWHFCTNKIFYIRYVLSFQFQMWSFCSETWFFHLKYTNCFSIPMCVWVHPAILNSCKTAEYNCAITWLLHCETYQLLNFHNKHFSEHHCTCIWHSRVYLWHKFLEVQLLSERAHNGILNKPNSMKYQQTTQCSLSASLPSLPSKQTA